MKVESLKLSNYRNYQQIDLSFNDGLTILTGKNAQGKTNLLEAIFLLSMGKSHRTNHDNELIKWGQDFAQIDAIISTKNFDFPLSMSLGPKGKIVKYNYVEQAKLSSFIGKLNVILFSPEDLQLVKGSPSLRRKFLDAELGQSHPVYLQELLDYHRILKQRNRYLKEMGRSDKFDDLYFEILTDQLIEKAYEIVLYRSQFIQTIEEIAQPIHHELSNANEALRIQYKASSSKLDYSQLDSLKDQFKDIFKIANRREKEQGLTVYGPHRDDLIFYLNENNAQLYGSQGQQRSIVLSLKLAEIEWLYRSIGEYPVLLLDDVLSELDDYRQHILMAHIEGKVQTFLTTASIKGLKINQLKNATTLFVNQGQITFKEGD